MELIVEPRPPQRFIQHEEVHGLFGMYEMELAADVIISVSERTGVPIGRVVVTPWYFLPADGKYEDGNDHVIVGFCHLLGGGFMRAVYPNGHFAVDQSFIDRLRKRKIWKRLPAATFGDVRSTKRSKKRKRK